MTDDNAQLHVSLDKDVKHRIRVEAAQRGMSMSELGRDVIEDWVEEHAGHVAES